MSLSYSFTKFHSNIKSIIKIIIKSFVKHTYNVLTENKTLSNHTYVNFYTYFHLGNNIVNPVRTCCRSSSSSFIFQGVHRVEQSAVPLCITPYPYPHSDAHYLIVNSEVSCSYIVFLEQESNKNNESVWAWQPRSRYKQHDFPSLFCPAIQTINILLGAPHGVKVEWLLDYWVL